MESKNHLRPVARPDKLTAQRIEVGIVLQQMLGTKDGALYFAQNGIPIAVAVRVLCSPANRRQEQDCWQLPVEMTAPSELSVQDFSRRCDSLRGYMAPGVDSETADKLLREMLLLDGMDECEAQAFYLGGRQGGGLHRGRIP
jgi:hypothetical protein